jgi:transcriptional regulator with GAF, ATPase, and Fis domain
VSTQVGTTTEEDRRSGSRGETVVQASLVRLVDCARPLAPSARHALRGLDRVELGRGEGPAERVVENGERVLRIQVPDTRVSSTHARLRFQLGRWLVEDLDSRNGTLLGGEPVRTAALADGDLLELGRTFFLFRDGQRAPADQPPDAVARPGEIAGLTTLSPALSGDLGDLAAVARSTVSVVIEGETGTGKEVVARALHALSGRRGPFVPVNCGAIPDSLVESELFGVRRGAYSDAKEDRPGLVRSAHEGTLFLDEIGDLPLALQAAFLRVLQEREVVPVGHARAVPVDLRVVSASHRDIEKLTAAGKFREDLWARLSGFTIRLPALRARREDLGLLIASLVERLAPEPRRVTFHPDAMRLLVRHGWPRNVRELEKRLGAALVLCGDGPVQVAHLGDLARRVAAAPSAPDEDAESAARRAEIVRLLGEHGGNLSAVARALGKDRVQVRRWLRRFGIDAASFRGGAEER